MTNPLFGFNASNEANVSFVKRLFSKLASRFERLECPLDLPSVAYEDVLAKGAQNVAFKDGKVLVHMPLNEPTYTVYRYTENKDIKYVAIKEKGTRKLLADFTYAKGRFKEGGTFNKDGSLLQYFRMRRRSFFVYNMNESGICAANTNSPYPVIGYNKRGWFAQDSATGDSIKIETPAGVNVKKA